MNSHQAKQIPISDYLNILGVQPKVKGIDYLLYPSPYREDTTPSLRVNLNKNSWYDLGTGEGGNILDLVGKVNNIDIKTNPHQIGEVLKILDNFKGYSHKDPKQMSLTADEDKTKELQKLESKLEIKKVQPLQNQALLNYLNSREINTQTAKEYLKEVYYINKENNKNYFALGFENDRGGFELRNEYFKGGLGHKDITHIKVNNSDKVIVFEGFMDYLSALSYYNTPKPKHNVIILNSANLKKRALEKIKNQKYSKLYSYLDRDKTGKETLEYFKKSLSNIEIEDKSLIYHKYKDFNEFIKSSPTKTTKEKQTKPQKPLNQKLSIEEKLKANREDQESQKIKNKQTPKIKEVKNIQSLTTFHHKTNFKNPSQVSLQYNEETKEKTIKLKPKL